MDMWVIYRMNHHGYILDYWNAVTEKFQYIPDNDCMITNLGWAVKKSQCLDDDLPDNYGVGVMGWTRS